MERPNVGRAIAAGFVATLAMTVLMYGGPMMGMPKMDIAGMLGSLLGQGMPAPASGAWWLGMIMHFINGTIIFPLIYVYLLYSVLPGAPWLRGAAWGVILWAIAQAVVMPMMGMGFFSSAAPQPMMAVAGSLIGHLIYGGILGVIAGRAAAEADAARWERRAA
ncbi:MAG: DUF6789 family protein [Gammaproteobacteria bacterium]